MTNDISEQRPTASSDVVRSRVLTGRVTSLDPNESIIVKNASTITLMNNTLRPAEIGYETVTVIFGLSKKLVISQVGMKTPLNIDRIHIYLCMTLLLSRCEVEFSWHMYLWDITVTQRCNLGPLAPFACLFI